MQQIMHICNGRLHAYLCDSSNRSVLVFTALVPPGLCGMDNDYGAGIVVAWAEAVEVLFLL